MSRYGLQALITSLVWEDVLSLASSNFSLRCSVTTKPNSQCAHNKQLDGLIDLFSCLVISLANTKTHKRAGPKSFVLAALLAHTIPVQHNHTLSILSACDHLQLGSLAFAQPAAPQKGGFRRLTNGSTTSLLTIAVLRVAGPLYLTLHHVLAVQSRHVLHGLGGGARHGRVLREGSRVQQDRGRDPSENRVGGEKLARGTDGVHPL